MYQNINEDAPVNNVGDGNIAGTNDNDYLGKTVLTTKPLKRKKNDKKLKSFKNLLDEMQPDQPA